MTYQEVTTGELIRESFRALQKNINTSVPGFVVSFQPLTNLAQLQIGVRKVDVNGIPSIPPIIIECPVQFTGSSQYIIEHQIDIGTEGIILFSQRCLDAWIDTGGIAENPILRIHNINDAMFIPGLRSQINVIVDFQNNGIRLRDRTGLQSIWLKNDGTAEINVTSLTVNGNLIVNGNSVLNGVDFNTHVHTQANDSGGNVEQNTGVPL